MEGLWVEGVLRIVGERGVLEGYLYVVEVKGNQMVSSVPDKGVYLQERIPDCRVRFRVLREGASNRREGR